MKKALMSMLVAGSVCTATAQDNAVADAARIHVAYEGVENPITIAAEHCDCNKLSLSVTEGELRKAPAGKPCEYIYVTTRPGKIDFTIKKKEGSGYKEIGKVGYVVKPLPMPYASIAGRHGGTIPLNQFKVQKGMMAQIDGFDFDTRYQVKSFRMDVLRNGQALFRMQHDSNIFNAAATAFFNKLLPGDKVVFTDIVCLKPMGGVAELESFDLTLQ